MDDPYHLMTLEIPDGSDVSEDVAAVSRWLGIATDSIEPNFGLIPIDPENRLYTLMVKNSAISALRDSHHELFKSGQIKGPFSNPGIEPSLPRSLDKDKPGGPLSPQTVEPAATKPQPPATDSVADELIAHHPPTNISYSTQSDHNAGAPTSMQSDSKGSKRSSRSDALGKNAADGKSEPD